MPHTIVYGIFNFINYRIWVKDVNYFVKYLKYLDVYNIVVLIWIMC